MLYQNARVTDAFVELQFYHANSIYLTWMCFERPKHHAATKIITEALLCLQIKYTHDGSETAQDTMILDVKLHAGTGYTLPNYLQGRLRFPLHVNVTSVNDPPALRIPSAKVLRLAQVSLPKNTHSHINTHKHATLTHQVNELSLFV